MYSERFTSNKHEPYIPYNSKPSIICSYNKHYINSTYSRRISIRIMEYPQLMNLFILYFNHFNTVKISNSASSRTYTVKLNHFKTTPSLHFNLTISRPSPFQPMQHLQYSIKWKHSMLGSPQFWTYCLKLTWGMASLLHPCHQLSRGSGHRYWCYRWIP